MLQKYDQTQIGLEKRSCIQVKITELDNLLKRIFKFILLSFFCVMCHNSRRRPASYQPPRKICHRRFLRSSSQRKVTNCYVDRKLLVWKFDELTNMLKKKCNIEKWANGLAWSRNFTGIGRWTSFQL